MKGDSAKPIKWWERQLKEKLT